MNETLVNYLHSFLFVYFPYLTLGVFLTGFIYRLTYRNKTVQALSTQFLSNDKMVKWGSNLFHFAVIMVFFGHIFGLLTPEPLYDWLITNETKRMLAIVMGSISGLICLIGVTLLMLRRFTNTAVRAHSSLADYFIVVLIFFQVLIGLMGTIVTLNSSLEAYLTIDYWAQGLCVFLPDSWRYLEDTHLIHKLHIINGFFIFMIFPFTKLMHMVVIPIGYLVDGIKEKLSR